MTPDEQEALSKAHSNEVILVLPLKSGRLAVFNNARVLCGITTSWETVPVHWRPPATAVRPSLEELGL